MPGLVVPPEAGYPPTGGLHDTDSYMHLPAEALQRTYTAGTLGDSKSVGGCKDVGEHPRTAR